MNDEIFCRNKFQGYMFICRNAEGVHAYLLKCCRGAFSFVGRLKRCMVRERLETSASYLQQKLKAFLCVMLPVLKQVMSISAVVESDP